MVITIIGIWGTVLTAPLNVIFISNLNIVSIVSFLLMAASGHAESIGASTTWAYKMVCTRVVMSKIRFKNVSIKIVYSCLVRCDR